MTGKVIQGFFVGGRARAPAPVAQPKAMPRPPGPPVPAFAGRPPVAQARGPGDSFQIDPAQVGLTSGGGRPLPDAVRGKMEAALGADFSNVRVHVGPQAERIGAVAFTMGTDIYFAPGRFQPDTVQGQQLLGHELAHVVQQRQGRVRNPLGSGMAVVQDRALEAEADRLGWRAAASPVRGTRILHSPAGRTLLQAARIAQGRTLGTSQRSVGRSSNSRQPAGNMNSVIQRRGFVETLTGGFRNLKDPIVALAVKCGTEPMKLLSVLLDTAYDLDGAIENDVVMLDLQDPLNFASCYPTAEHMFNLISRSGDVANNNLHGTNQDTYQNSSEIQAECNRLIAVMEDCENNERECICRIEIGGHGFMLAGAKHDDEIYKFDQVESLAHGTHISQSLSDRKNILLPRTAYQVLRQLVDADVNARRTGAGRMGWNGDALYLGDGYYPAIRFKWWVSRLHVQWRTLLSTQVKNRYNTLADHFGHDHI